MAKPRPRPAAGRLAFEALEDRTLLSATAMLGVMGDSLSARYATDPYIPGLIDVRGQYNWVEQLELLRSKDITIANQAITGATSSDLLAQGQHTTLVSLAASGAIDYAVLAIGANDAVFQFASTILAGDATPFVTTVAANVETALDTVAAAGDVHLVVANIPDVSVTPLFQFLVGGNPVLLQRLTAAITAANQQIEALADARDIPVVDLFGLSHLTLEPLYVGGVQITNLFTPDGFHPNTVGQGLLANTFLDALNAAGDLKTKHLRLSDQEILDLAGIPHPTQGQRTYFDVSDFVLSASDDTSDRSYGSRAQELGTHTIQATSARSMMADPTTMRTFGELMASMPAKKSDPLPITANIDSPSEASLQLVGMGMTEFKT